MSWWGNLLRRARLRGLREGLVQVVRAEALTNDARDDVERWQDYGFAAQPVDGEGLILHAGGHTIVLRMDRINDRPQLQAGEVCVWHKDGAYVKLKAGRVVEVEGDEIVLRASTSITLDAPVTTVPQPSLVLGGKQIAGHDHGGVSTGGGVTGPNR